MSENIDYLRKWVGKVETQTDFVGSTPVAALTATLDREDPLPQSGDPLPPLWQWLYFLPIHRHSEIGPDGHPARGGFLPPVQLPRRMFAGGRLQFLHPLRVGDAISRTSRVIDVNLKEGRVGSLVFVKVRHEISDGQGVAVTEDHDIVYRDNPKPGDPAPAPQAAPATHAWMREIRPDEVLLFRYSALTFNSHRIHYDRRYVTEVEGYPGLVVHGPLLAMLLLDLVRRNCPGAVVTHFTFRAVRPVFDLTPFSVCGELAADGTAIRLWAKDVDGWLAMDATASLD